MTQDRHNLEMPLWFPDWKAHLLHSEEEEMRVGSRFVRRDVIVLGNK